MKFQISLLIVVIAIQLFSSDSFSSGHFIAGRQTMRVLTPAKLPHRIRTAIAFSDFAREDPPTPKKEPRKNDDVNKEEQAAAAREEEEELSRQEISNQMRERLRAELRAQGADPNYSAGPILGNPILLISGIVAILVIFGGKDIFY